MADKIKKIKLSGATYDICDASAVKTVSATGTGNAITAAEVSGTEIILTKGETFATNAALASEVSRSTAYDVALSDRVSSLEQRGRYLSGWNATTHLPTTYPTIEVGETYTYKSGDYYIVTVVGTTNYKPIGTGITRTAEGYTVPYDDEDEEILVGDTYTYDGTSFVLTHSADNNQTVIVGTASFGPNDAVNFVASSNISISADVTAKSITIKAVDHITSIASKTGEGNAVTNITANASGNLNVTFGETFATKSELDAAVSEVASTYVKKAGDSMSGDLSFANTKGVKLLHTAGTAGNIYANASGYLQIEGDLGGVNIGAAAGPVKITGQEVKISTEGTANTIIDNITVPKNKSGEVFATTSDVSAAVSGVAYVGSDNTFTGSNTFNEPVNANKVIAAISSTTNHFISLDASKTLSMEGIELTGSAITLNSDLSNESTGGMPASLGIFTGSYEIEGEQGEMALPYAEYNGSTLYFPFIESDDTLVTAQEIYAVLSDYLPTSAGSENALTGDLYLNSGKNIVFDGSGKISATSSLSVQASNITATASGSICLTGSKTLNLIGGTGSEYCYIYLGGQSGYLDLVGTASHGTRIDGILVPKNKINETFATTSDIFAALSGVAYVGSDNTFTGANTFNGAITATSSVNANNITAISSSNISLTSGLRNNRQVELVLGSNSSSGIGYYKYTNGASSRTVALPYPTNKASDELALLSDVPISIAATGSHTHSISASMTGSGTISVPSVTKTANKLVTTSIIPAVNVTTKPTRTILGTAVKASKATAATAKSFNTDAIKYAGLTGTTTFNTDAIKSAALDVKTSAATGYNAYVESVGATTLTGTKTFITGYDSFSGGSLTGTKTFITGLPNFSGGSLGGDVTFIKSLPSAAYTASYASECLTLDPITPTTGTVTMTAASLGALASGTVGFTAASLGTASTGTVGISSGTVTTKYLGVTTEAASTATIGISTSAATTDTITPYTFTEIDVPVIESNDDITVAAVGTAVTVATGALSSTGSGSDVTSSITIGTSSQSISVSTTLSGRTDAAGEHTHEFEFEE